MREGETLGFRAVFLPEIAGRDATAALAALAGVTSELLLGTGIVPMTARRDQLTAMAAPTVHERSGGRAILGIGTGAPRLSSTQWPTVPTAPARSPRRSVPRARRVSCTHLLDAYTGVCKVDTVEKGFMA